MTRGWRRFRTTTIEVEGREETKVVELPDRELAPWDASAALTVVGASVPRVDARDKVTGAARYTAESRSVTPVDDAETSIWQEGDT